MRKGRSIFTVYFDEPFWVGVYERWEGDRLSVSRVVFGAEPSDGQVYKALLENWHRLRFSRAVVTEMREERIRNSKRRQREIGRAVSSAGSGTKAQQALKQQYEENKQAAKRESRVQAAQEKDEKFARKQEKRKQKHRGH